MNCRPANDEGDQQIAGAPQDAFQRGDPVLKLGMTSFAFLFGSGISLHAGLPTTAAITDAVFTGLRANTSKQVVEHVRHHSDGRFEFTDQPDESPSLSGPLLLKSSGVEFIDGFALSRGGDGLRLWNSSLFDAPSSNVRVVKLHGSVDWFREIPNRREHSPIPFKFGDSRPSEKLDIDRPLILIGTHNKPVEYTNKVYEDLHVQLYLALKGIHRLVICGYGFNDKGINTRLIHWMSRSADHRIVLIHKNPEDCILNARGAIQREWHYWGAERARFERAWAEDVAWPELRRSIA